MGPATPAKGAKVSINDSTLGDIAAEEPPMKLSLIARKAYVGPGKRFKGQSHHIITPRGWDPSGQEPKIF